MPSDPKRPALVRVFLRTHRRSELLRRALSSLLAQSLSDWVCELHNDAPGDPYPAELAARTGDPRITVVDHPINLGGVGTFNLMFEPRPERFVSLLEDDNWWEPRFLERMVSEMEARPEITVGWSNMRIWREEPDGRWTDTGQTVQPRPADAAAELVSWPSDEQSWRALSSNGAMLIRAGDLEGFRIPLGTRFDFAEPVRERAMPHPLLFVPEPLVNFSLTRDSTRTTRRDGSAEHYVLLLASFFRHARPGEETVRAIWSEARKSPVRSTDKLILAGLYAPECRPLLRSASVREWLGFLCSSIRRPALFWRALRARDRYPELWTYLDKHTRDRCASPEAMTARILIVTDGPLCRNPRPLKEAETLARAGYDVTVLTVRNDAVSETRDGQLLRDTSFQRETIDLLASDRSPRWMPLIRRGRLWAARKLSTHLRLRTMESLGPARALLRRARSTPADLTIVHNETPHWVGTRLMADGRRVAADIEDWHSEDLLPADRRSRPLALLREIEQELLKRAIYTTTTSNALADALHARHGGSRPRVLTNSFPLQPDPHRSPPGNPPAFFWFSQTLGPGRGLESFLAGWTLSSSPSRLVLLGESRGHYGKTMIESLPASHRNRIEFLPLVSPAELPAVIARHDIGLALEDSAIVSRNLTITNKILQYLNAGLAVLASDTVGQREVLGHDTDAGTLVSLCDPGKLAAALDRLLNDPSALARSQSAARRLAENSYCWERESHSLLSLVEEALAAPCP